MTPETRSLVNEGLARAALRSKYVTDSVETMSPQRMIVALYDRLLLDLDRAADAIGKDDPVTAHECLVHAQSVVGALHDALDLERWGPARRLGDLYTFVFAELVTANVDKDGDRVRSCRALLAPLRDAWHEAAGVVPSGSGGAP